MKSTLAELGGARGILAVVAIALERGLIKPPPPEPTPEQIAQQRVKTHAEYRARARERWLDRSASYRARGLNCHGRPYKHPKTKRRHCTSHARKVVIQQGPGRNAHWKVLGEDYRLLADGYAPNKTQAKRAALKAKLRLAKPHERCD